MGSIVVENGSILRHRARVTAGWLLELPVEVVIASARLIFASVATVAVITEGGQAADVPVPSALLLGYNLLAVALLVYAILDKPSKFTHLGMYASHGFDIIFSTTLISLSQGVASPFFVFFQFTLIAATLRWSWRGALATAGLLTILLWGMYWSGVSPQISTAPLSADDLTRTWIRGGSLLISGAMLAYLGAYRERSRQRLAQLAAWPRVHITGDKLALLRTVLAYSANVMQTPRLLLIWDEEDEPDRHLALWAEGQLHYSRENADLFGALLAPSRDDEVMTVFHGTGNPAPAGAQEEPLIDGQLIDAFAIRSAASAPFSTTACRGRVLALDRTFWSEDDRSLIALIAARIGLTLEERLLRDQLTAGAALKERVRLGRDLHDGILQGLAAASIQLKVLSVTAPETAQDQLTRVRAVLADEVQRIRAFVEATRVHVEPTTGLVRLADDLRPRVLRLRELWLCQIELSIEPPDLNTSITAARNIGHMVAEAVSNAVRHGEAARVDIDIERVDENITLRIRDNGRGFKSLTAPLGRATSLAARMPPLSLKSRIEELGGRLYLTSSDEGTSLTIELPA